MIFETAVLDVIPQKAQEFEYAFKQARKNYFVYARLY